MDKDRGTRIAAAGAALADASQRVSADYAYGAIMTGFIAVAQAFGVDLLKQGDEEVTALNVYMTEGMAIAASHATDSGFLTDRVRSYAAAGLTEFLVAGEWKNLPKAPSPSAFTGELAEGVAKGLEIRGDFKRLEELREAIARLREAIRLGLIPASHGIKLAAEAPVSLSEDDLRNLLGMGSEGKPVRDEPIGKPVDEGYDRAQPESGDDGRTTEGA